MKMTLGLMTAVLLAAPVFAQKDADSRLQARPKTSKK